MTNFPDLGETLFRGRHVTVIARDAGSDAVFVTFNPLLGITPGDLFWSESFLRKQQITAIGIVSSEPDWFPADEMQSAVEAIRRRTAGRRLLTYGYSRGGYGALKYSRALGAERAIAFCPRFSAPANPVAGNGAAYLDGLNLEPGDLCACNHMFYDPASVQDAHTMRRIEAVAAAAGVHATGTRVPFSGHGSLMQLIEGGVAEDLIEQLASGSPPDSRGLRTLVRRARRKSTTYHQLRLMWLLDRRSRDLRQLSSAVSSIPPGPVRAFAQMSLFVAESRADDATAILQYISDEALLKLFPPMWCWRYFRDSRFLAGERRLAPLLKAGMPGDPFARLLAVNSYITLGERETASREFDEALALDGVEHLRKEVVVIAWLLGRPDPFAGRERT